VLHTLRRSARQIAPVVECAPPGVSQHGEAAYSERSYKNTPPSDCFLDTYNYSMLLHGTKNPQL